MTLCTRYMGHVPINNVPKGTEDMYGLLCTHVSRLVYDLLLFISVMRQVLLNLSLRPFYVQPFP